MILASLSLAVGLLAGAADVPPPVFTDTVITDAVVTDVQYSCAVSTGWALVHRDIKHPVFIRRVIIGTNLRYEIYAQSSTTGRGAILLATCDALVIVPKPG